MTNLQLKDIDPEEIADILKDIESSFNFKFDRSELKNISTFGQLCDLVGAKIQLDNSNDCSSQQAFYKLRDAISSTLNIDKQTISTNFSLVHLLPRIERRSITRKLENHLGFKLYILRPPYWLTWTITILILGSFIGLFFNWQIGLSGLILSIFGLWIASKFANELDLETVGQLAEKMTRENYLKSRRNPKTFNKSEIEKVLIDLFSTNIGIDKSALTREAKFI